LRFATAHRFFAASEILFRPAALRPCRDSGDDLAGGLLAAWATRAFTTSIARPTEAFAESSNSRNPRALAGQLSMTRDSIDSTLFNLFRAFFDFIAAPENSAAVLRTTCLR
jgi:hypothetical protein